MADGEVVGTAVVGVGAAAVGVGAAVAGVAAGAGALQHLGLASRPERLRHRITAMDMATILATPMLRLLPRPTLWVWLCGLLPSSSGIGTLRAALGEGLLEHFPAAMNLISASTHRLLRATAFTTWREAVGVAA